VSNPLRALGSCLRLPSTATGGRNWSGKSTVRIEWSSASGEDLRGIKDFIGADNPVAAARVIRTIRQSAQIAKLFNMIVWAQGI